MVGRPKLPRLKRRQSWSIVLRVSLTLWKQSTHPGRWGPQGRPWRRAWPSPSWGRPPRWGSRSCRRLPGSTSRGCPMSSPRTACTPSGAKRSPIFDRFKNDWNNKDWILADLIRKIEATISSLGDKASNAKPLNLAPPFWQVKIGSDWRFSLQRNCSHRKS